jgi:hypothetical protein
MRSRITLFLIKYYWNYQIKEDKMGMPSSTRGREVNVLVGKPEENIPLGRPQLGERIILKWILKEYDGRV